MKMLLNGLMMSLASTLLITLLSLGITELYAEVPETQQVTSNEQSRIQQSQNELIELYFAAAKSGNNEVVQEFLNNGFPVDIRNGAGYTALIIATYYGHQAVVSSLLEHGADRCLRDRKGNTALMGAIFKLEWSIAKQLRKIDCDVGMEQTGHKTVAAFAKVVGQDENLQKLIHGQL